MLPRQTSLFRFPFSSLRQCCSSLSFLGVLPCPCNELIVISPTAADFVEKAVAASSAVDDNDVSGHRANENLKAANDELAYHPYRKSYREKQSPKQPSHFGRWSTCKKSQKGLHPRMDKGSVFRLRFICHDYTFTPFFCRCCYWRVRRRQKKSGALPRFCLLEAPVRA